MTRKARSGAALAAVLTGLVSAMAMLRPAHLAADSRPGANHFPNVTLTTQDGEEVRFYDLIKGKIVAINLIYTTCKFACPLETARLAQVQKLLGDRMGRDVFFYSITIDPEHDTPSVLKAYAEKFHTGPGWLFLTGSRADIDLISKKIGLYSPPNPSDDGHMPMLLIGNEATGEWTRTSALDNPKYTVRILTDWMSTSYVAKSERSYTEAKPIVNRDNGKYLYTSLCANCHSIGEGRKIGPDLSTALGLRDREWLTGYITQPDAMRAQNDRAAMALMKQFPEVRMPNLGLNADEARQILRYIGEQKAHGDTNAAAPAASHEPAAVGSRALIDPAVAVQESLARDSMEGVRESATALRDAAGKIGSKAADIETAAADLAKQTTLADARNAFGTLTDALIAHLHAEKAAPPEGIRIGYCPMVRKSWLQKNGAVANPYFGSRMLTCGELTE
jgi:protein SCO1/2